ncbi:MAG: hypothetical protein ABSB35_23435 [Bryobacteraceae bacterium]|jgi:hypothetical protein
MSIEIHQPELERRLRERIYSGGSHEDALSEKEAAGRMLFEQGLGLFGSPEDSALLDKIVSMAYAERRRPSKRQLASALNVDWPQR